MEFIFNHLPMITVSWLWNVESLLSYSHSKHFLIKKENYNNLCWFSVLGSFFGCVLIFYYHLGSLSENFSAFWYCLMILSSIFFSYTYNFLFFWSQILISCQLLSMLATSAVTALSLLPPGNDNLWLLLYFNLNFCLG